MQVSSRSQDSKGSGQTMKGLTHNPTQQRIKNTQELRDQKCPLLYMYIYKAIQSKGVIRQETTVGAVTMTQGRRDMSRARRQKSQLDRTGFSFK